MDVTSEPGLFACCDHRAADVIDSRIAFGRPEDIARFRFMLGQPRHHIVAEGHFACSPALGQDESHNPAVEVNFFPFKRRRFSQPCPSDQEEVGHGSKGRLKMLKQSRHLVRSEIINHPVSRSRHKFNSRERIAGYPLLFDRTVQHAPQRADLEMNGTLRNRFAGPFPIHVVPSAINIFSDMIRLQLEDVLHGQVLKNSRHREVRSESMFLAAIGQKPLDIVIGELRQQWPSAIPILDSEVHIPLHLLLYLSALVLGFRLRGHAYLLPPMPKPGVPSDLPISSNSSPWHARIQR